MCVPPTPTAAIPPTVQHLAPKARVGGVIGELHRVDGRDVESHELQREDGALVAHVAVHDCGSHEGDPQVSRSHNPRMHSTLCAPWDWMLRQERPPAGAADDIYIQSRSVQTNQGGLASPPVAPARSEPIRSGGPRSRPSFRGDKQASDHHRRHGMSIAPTMSHALPRGLGMSGPGATLRRRVRRIGSSLCAFVQFRDRLRSGTRRSREVGDPEFKPAPPSPGMTPRARRSPPRARRAHSHAPCTLLWSPHATS